MHAKMLALGDLAVLVGDLNAEPAKAGASARALADHFHQVPRDPGGTPTVLAVTAQPRASGQNREQSQ